MHIECKKLFGKINLRNKPERLVRMLQQKQTQSKNQLLIVTQIKLNFHLKVNKVQIDFYVKQNEERMINCEQNE